MVILDENNKVSEYLKSLELDCSGITRIDLSTFEMAQGFEGEIIIVEDSCFLQMSALLKAKLADLEAVLIFSSTGVPIVSYGPNIISVFNKEMPKELLENQIRYLEKQIQVKAILKSQMINLNGELNELIGSVGIQLKRVKKLYEKKAPKRLENFKGLSVISKYAAGENGGGEFFDLYSTDSKLLLMMSSCSSFLASSSLLQYFSELKATEKVNDKILLGFIKKISNELEVINKSRKKKATIDLFLGIIDFADLKMDGYKFGEFQILSNSLENEITVQNRDFTKPEKSKFTLQLERSQRILLNSSGFMKNWSLTNVDFLIEELFLNNKNRALDILDELYFNLKKKSMNGFLAHDASSVMLEVDENVMVQI